VELLGADLSGEELTVTVIPQKDVRCSGGGGCRGLMRPPDEAA
jgi:hypothetical protein